MLRTIIIPYNSSFNILLKLLNLFFRESLNIFISLILEPNLLREYQLYHFFQKLGEGMPTLMFLFGVISRPCRDWLIKFMVMMTSMQLIDVINYFQPEIVN